MPKTSSVRFFGLPLEVSEAVLTPRLETECLVRFALQELSERPADGCIDVGTGSGAIALAIASRFPNCSVCALDISENALDIGRKNATALKLPVVFIKSDLLDGFSRKDFSWKNLFFLANLPYLRKGDPQIGADVLEEDPPIALFSDSETGFHCIERFLEQCASLKDVARSIRIILEFGDDQLSLAEENAEKYGFSFSSFPDYSGTVRFCFLRYDR